MPTHSEIHELAEQDRFELSMRFPLLYGRVICSVSLVVVRDPRVQLACTDYSRIFISGDAYSALPEEKRLAVLAHEALHIALRHAFRIGSRDKNRFEKAADAEVHFILSEHLPDPYETWYPNDWAELTAEQIYDLLPYQGSETKPRSMHCSPNDNQSDDKQSGNGGKMAHGNAKSDQQDGGNTGADGKPSGGRNTGANGKPSSGGNAEANGNAQFDQSTGSEDKQKRSRGSLDSRGTKQDGRGDGKAVNGGRRNVCNDEQSDDGDEQEDEFPEFRPQFDAETEMNCIALSFGTMMDMRRMGDWDALASSPIRRLLKKLEKPRVGWQVLLRQYLRTCRGGAYSWSHPNRRFISRGLYLPGRTSIKSFNGIIALDTSPSTIDVLPRFVSELTGVFKAFGNFDLTIIECAARILQVWNVSSDKPMPDIESHKFMGDLGTDFSTVFEYIYEHRLTPNVLIYFTDGEGGCPEDRPPYPVLWMLTKGGRKPVPWGQAICYEEN